MTIIVRNRRRSTLMAPPRWRGVLRSVPGRLMGPAALRPSLVDITFRRRKARAMAAAIHRHHHGQFLSSSVIHHHHHSSQAGPAHSHQRMLAASVSTSHFISQFIAAAPIERRRRGSRLRSALPSMVRYERLHGVATLRERSIIERSVSLRPWGAAAAAAMASTPRRERTPPAERRPSRELSTPARGAAQMPLRRRLIDSGREITNTGARVVRQAPSGVVGTVTGVRPDRAVSPELARATRPVLAPQLSLAWRNRPAPATAAPLSESTTPSRSSGGASQREFVHATAGSPSQQAEPSLKASPLSTAADLSPALIDQLADDVMRRMDRRMRIERERRGM